MVFTAMKTFRCSWAFQRIDRGSQPAGRFSGEIHIILNGRTLYYANAIGTDPMMAEIILEMVNEFDQKHLPSAVSN